MLTSDDFREKIKPKKVSLEFDSSHFAYKLSTSTSNRVWKLLFKNVCLINDHFKTTNTEKAQYTECVLQSSPATECNWFKLVQTNLKLQRGKYWDIKHSTIAYLLLLPVAQSFLSVLACVCIFAAQYFNKVKLRLLLQRHNSWMQEHLCTFLWMHYCCSTTCAMTSIQSPAHVTWCWITFSFLSIQIQTLTSVRGSRSTCNVIAWPCSFEMWWHYIK